MERLNYSQYLLFKKEAQTSIKMALALKSVKVLYF